MTSLTEVYDGNAREVSSLRRLKAGTALVVLGALLSIVALLLATTDLLAGVAATIGDPFGTVEATARANADQYAAVRVAGVLAGLGVPAALVGVFIVLPAGRWVRAAGAISASLCLFGVTLFWYAYPLHWRGVGDDLTLQVSAVYLLGLFVALWCLFTAVVNFKTRNDPGGMLEMYVTQHNQTIVEAPEEPEPEPDTSGFGGVGFFGATPDGEVETQTNAPAGSADDTQRASRSQPTPEAEPDEGTILQNEPSRRSRSSSSATSSPTPGAPTPSSDGGSTTADISSPLESGPGADAGAEIVESPSPPTTSGSADRYCGNCTYFEYVRSNGGILPYCARHDTAMDDMDACEEWTPNSK
ncbi:DUF7139 domain-containing protein [Natrarchaeobaculum aegyptiacum]|uniref:Uncharacterized protein n=1 Tax=Natrarchaeobaculum aegyptiacum TaxID=745377 RepID=A0A2Z2HNV9_9EURY|nr:hypothetical protein [Natrarchaeobaculum aegyptiacum]ARS88621.1 hypothetical protein B1756_01835 [Natrarchaeobaculum aegyptiacum]